MVPKPCCAVISASAYDVCHGSGGIRESGAAIDRLLAAGIEVPKSPAFAAMRVPGYADNLIEEVMRYDDAFTAPDDRARPCGLTRYVDLPDAIAAFKGGSARRRWRITATYRFFLSGPGRDRLDSDRSGGDAGGISAGNGSSHLEVETIPGCSTGQFADRFQAADIAREISFCAKELADER